MTKHELILKNHPNLSEIEGKVGKVVLDAYPTLKELFEDEAIEDEEFKLVVLELLNRATGNYKKKVILELNRLKDKYSIINYLTNIMLKGDHLGSL